jgi:hypothetical protein
MLAGSIEKNVIASADIDCAPSGITATDDPNPSIIYTIVAMIVIRKPKSSVVRQYFGKRALCKAMITMISEICEKSTADV